MWTLECDGDSLAHKKIWLRPGKKYLFGRTKEPKGQNAGFKIDHKSVSRQHLTLSISKVKPGDGSVVSKRSEVTLKDEDTKFKTEVDGESIKNHTRTLRKDEHVFRLGNSEQKFYVRWQPVVFTFSLTSKELKAGKDPLANQRSRLEDLDVRVIIPYIIESTTHVVAGKRNTAKGLQALINAKNIVAESFIDALICATTPTDLDAEESLSPLEEDFDGNWPNTADHLPAKSKEPSERPAEDFVPNVERARVFEGYTFIFFDQLQFETLHAPIANGAGKALYHELDSGKTTSDDIVLYVKSVAGEKGLGEFEDGSEGKGVVVVKFRSKENPEWAAQMDYQVAQALDHRLIEQSEFLDAILNNDASMLRRPLLPNDDETPSTHPAYAQGTEAQEAEQPVEPDEPKPASRRRARGPVVSRFKGFDDDDDDIKPSSSRPFPEESHMDSATNGRSQYYSNGTSFANGDSMELDSSNQVNGNTQASTSRKRPAPSSDIEEEEDLVDKLLPATTAIKRRRLEEDAEAERTGISPNTPFDVSEPQPETEKKKTKPKKEINIQEKMRARRQAEDEAAKQDEEVIRDSLEGMSVEEMKNLAVVEEMPIPTHRRRAPQRTNGEDKPRWDDRWNGRRNFKKFRRRGDGVQARRGQSVIVPLEEVKKKDFGIGEEYWLERDNNNNNNNKTQRKREERERAAQNRLQSTPYVTARSQAADVPSELVDSSAEGVPETIDVDAPRATRHGERSQRDDDGGGRSLAGGRKAGGVHIAGPKKRKRFAAARDSDCDSEEDAGGRGGKRVR